MFDFAIGFILVASVLAAVWYVKKRSRKIHLSPAEKAALMRRDPTELTLSEAIQRKIIEKQSTDNEPL